MKIEDNEVRGTLISDRGQWYLRLTAPSLTNDIPDMPYLWYKMTTSGWVSISNNGQQERTLEDFYRTSKQ